MFHASEDLRFQFLLEPQYNIFQRAVKANVYNQFTAQTAPIVSVPVNAVANNGNATQFTCTNAGDVVKIAVGTIVNVTYTLNTVVATATRKITAFTPDQAGPPAVNGTFTLDQSITGVATDDLTAITFNTVSTDVYTLNCNQITAQTDTLTLVTPAAQNLDLYIGTTCKITYKTYVPGTVSNFQYVVREVIDFTVVNNLITQVKFKTAFNTTNETWTQMHIEPLYTNLQNNWSVTDAHLVVYRRAGGEKPSKMMALQTFQSVNYAILGQLDKSFYTIKSPINTYNAYALLPTNDNMISVCEDVNENGSISQYRVYVDELPLTSIYIPINSALHEDNLMRVLDNSSEYKPMNLRQDRDNTVVTQKKPDVVVAKLFNSVLGNKVNLQNPQMDDRNLKLELTGGPTGTPQKNVYCFMEMFKFV
jgi:hypothetical protein